ncbi:MAG: TrpR-related protein YerC/YecD [Clostridia bacterium]|nr:TrpR-related protein YerC/YecD [Clostridia bacterium]
MQNKNKKERLVTLYETLCSMQTPLECKRFLEDLCTETELQSMAQRLHAAKMLLDGKTYVQVIEDTGLSSATVSRISKCVQFGKGYSRLK